MAAPPAVVVVDFFTHGSLTEAGDNLAVYARDALVAWRVLQVGPGDYCRVAFQPERERRQYSVCYGGKGLGVGKSPAWQPTPGLLLETRVFKACDLQKLDSVREAFGSSKPLGADFVEQIYHRQNPFTPVAGPFLSRYTGTLRVPLAGKCVFFTSSQDCSFLLVDDKLVVAAPGAHPPQHQARIKGEVTLTEGTHRLEYWHAAAGVEACMVAAWQLPGFDKPNPIAPEIFETQKIAHVLPGRFDHRPGTPWADFRLQVAGDVPLEDHDQPLVRVRFASLALPVVSDGARFVWDFGDGQGEEGASPQHIYLHPGEYRVTMSVRHGDTKLDVTNRLRIDQPALPPQADRVEDKLEDYLKLLDHYRPATLDPAGLLNLVRARLQAGQWQAAADAGRTAFSAASARHTDESRWQIARLLGPVLRDRLKNAEAACELWREAGKHIRRAEWRARCAVEAADLLIHELRRPEQAGPLVEFAVSKLTEGGGEGAAQALRISGDWQARRGDGPAARSSYAHAAAARGTARTTTERTAWRGARSRSVEAFLRDQDFDRARDELRSWELDFPEDKAEGYLSLQWARYWSALDQSELVIDVARDLVAVNPTSPYADRLVAEAAQAQEKLQQTDRALATWRTLVSDYPGSALVPHAKEIIARLTRPP